MLGSNVLPKMTGLQITSACQYETHARTHTCAHNNNPVFCHVENGNKLESIQIVSFKLTLNFWQGIHA